MGLDGVSRMQGLLFWNLINIFIGFGFSGNYCFQIYRIFFKEIVLNVAEGFFKVKGFFL